MNINNDFSITNEIEKLIGSIQKSDPEILTKVRIQTAWYECVGESIRQHTDAIFVVPNTHCSEIIIYIDDHLWTAELTMRSEVLRIELNLKIHELEQEETKAPFNTSDFSRALKTDQVHKLKFITSKEKYRKKTPNQVVNFSAQKKPLIKVEPLSYQEEEFIKQQVDSIEDPELKQAIYNAAYSQIAWHNSEQINKLESI